MFLGGAELGLGGADPQKIFALRAKKTPTKFFALRAKFVTALRALFIGAARIVYFWEIRPPLSQILNTPLLLSTCYDSVTLTKQGRILHSSDIHGKKVIEIKNIEI